MEIFCYDLMLAETWASKRPEAITLMHDSNLYADVDDRQIAAALELAVSKAKAGNFQYICTFNSDKLPLSEFTKGFDIAAFTRLTLTDETEEGGLLGIRLPSTATRAPRISSQALDEGALRAARQAEDTGAAEMDLALAEEGAQTSF